jgi:ElaB/YqjD/DUF883 family membrane-anchored ribosome-binding protein
VAAGIYRILELVMSKHKSAINLADEASNALDNATDAAADVFEDARSGVQNIGDSIARNSADVAGKVNAKLKGAGIDAEPLVAAARDRTSDLGTALIDEIKSRPLQAVAAAAIAGLVVGVLTSR